MTGAGSTGIQSAATATTDPQMMFASCRPRGATNRS